MSGTTAEQSFVLIAFLGRERTNVGVGRGIHKSTKNVGNFQPKWSSGVVPCLNLKHATKVETGSEAGDGTVDSLLGGQQEGRGEDEKKKQEETERGGVEVLEKNSGKTTDVDESMDTPWVGDGGWPPERHFLVLSL